MTNIFTEFDFLLYSISVGNQKLQNDKLTVKIKYDGLRGMGL